MVRHLPIVDAGRCSIVMFVWIDRSSGRRIGRTGQEDVCAKDRAAARRRGGWRRRCWRRPPAMAQDVTVFAAASLKNALDDVNAAWKAETGKEAAISYAASSALAKQIEEGGAGRRLRLRRPRLDGLSRRAEPDRAGHRGRSCSATASCWSRRPIPTSTAEIAPGFDLAGLLGDGRLAMANVDAVPAGKYGKAALEHARRLGRASRTSVAQAENVRAALALVATGEAPLGIVYQTDANADPAVRSSAPSPRTAIRRSSIRSR